MRRGAEERLVLGLLVVLAVAAMGLAWGSVAETPTAAEATWVLAAESLVHDGDLLFSFEDEERLRRWPARYDVRPSLLVTGSRLHFAPPAPYAYFLAPFVAFAPAAGPLLANVVLLGVLLLVAYRSLDRSGEGPPGWLLLAAVFGTVVAVALRSAVPTLFAATVTAVGMALLAYDAPVTGARLRDMYPAEPSPGRSFVRWIVAGAVLGVVGLHHPVYLLLLPAAAVTFVPRQRLLQALAAAGLGAAAVVLGVWWAGGLWPDFGAAAEGSERVRISVRGAPASIERATLQAVDSEQWRLAIEHPRLLLWNGLYALVGRHVGVLPYFPLVAWLVASSLGSGRRRLLVLAAMVCVVALVVWSPFNFAGLPAAVGFGLFAPFFVALWWAPVKPLGKAGSFGALAVGLAVLWPYWNPSIAPLRALEQGRAPAGPVLERLPYETTQRFLPARGEVVTRELLVRAIGGLEPGGRQGHFRLLDGHGEVLIAAKGRLGLIELRFGSTAGLELAAEGWAVLETLLTPRGEVVFTLRPHGKARLHPVWWSEDLHEVYLLRFDIEAPPGTIVSVGS